MMSLLRHSPRDDRNRGRSRRTLGIRIGLVSAGLGLALVLSAGGDSFRAKGPMNSGHQDLACADCHLAAPGTLRQKLQANARYLAGLRADAADMGARVVGSERCQVCHWRPNDRHPIYRFLEPRFAEVRASLGAHDCVSCHREHRGARVTAVAGFCVECHRDLELRSDPLDVPHRQLVAEESWLTCLGCHDFHGNHALEPATRLAAALAPASIARYLAGGDSPYPLPVLHPALRSAPVRPEQVPSKQEERP
jgi:hypothetical protein